MTRMYAACLASYNAGTLHGEWLDLDGLSADEIRQEITDKVLLTSPCPNVTVECPDCDGAGDGCPRCDGLGTVESAEEWAAHDWEDMPNFLASEYPDLDDVALYVEGVGEHGEPYAAFCDYLDEVASGDNFQSAYIGGFDSWEEVAQDYVDNTGMLDSVPESLRNYFDYEAFGRDLSHDGFEHNGHYFWSNY
jgi:antirestriction protein